MLPLDEYTWLPLKSIAIHYAHGPYSAQSNGPGVLEISQSRNRQPVHYSTCAGQAP